MSLRHADRPTARESVTVAAIFVGTNHNDTFGERQTTSTVTRCEPPRYFEWTVGDPHDFNTWWWFSIDADHDGAITVTQWVQLGPGPSGLHDVIAARPDAEERIVASRLNQFRRDIRATLAVIKAEAEVSSR